MSVNTLIFGKTKCGKTRSLDTLPSGVLDFSFDVGGWKSLGRGKKKVIVVRSFKEWLDDEKKPTLGKDEILVVDYATVGMIKAAQYTNADTTLIMNFINDHNLLWSRQEECVGRGIRHVVIDSLTSFQQPVLEFILALNGRLITVQQDWGQAIAKVNEILQSGVATPFDYILIAHTHIEKDELTGKIEEGLLIYGKTLPNVILAKFDDIFYATIENTPTGQKYLWGTMPEGFLKGVGTRNFDGLPSKIEPNFEKFYKDKLFNGTV